MHQPHPKVKTVVANGQVLHRQLHNSEKEREMGEKLARGEAISFDANDKDGRAILEALGDPWCLPPDEKGERDA